MFVLLLNVSGVGPAMALSILSWMPLKRFVTAVVTDDASTLVSIPGIGKAKAEKLIFEMKRKTGRLEELASPEKETGPARDALDALVALGFDEKKAGPVLNEILKNTPSISLENAIKEALKNLK